MENAENKDTQNSEQVKESSPDQINKTTPVPGMSRRTLLKRLAVGGIAVTGGYVLYEFAPWLNFEESADHTRKSLAENGTAPDQMRELVRYATLAASGHNTHEPGTWGFFLKPVNANTTRLLIRNRGDWKSGLLRNAISYGIYEPTHFIMEQKMMRTIKHLAERNTSV